MATKKELQAQLDTLEADYQALVRDYSRKCCEIKQQRAPEIPVQPKRPNPVFGYDRWWDLTIRFNPLSWSGGRWYRFNWRKAGTSTREGQADFGPFSWSWYREVKR